MNQKFVDIAPKLFLEKDWIHRLKERFFESEKMADFRAWQRAKINYYEDICDLYHYPRVIGIDSMDYDLEQLIKEWEFR